MTIYKYPQLTLTLFLTGILLFNESCKKEIPPEEYTDNTAFIQNLNIDANYASGIFNRPSGGYAIAFSTTVNQSYTDAGVALVDRYGNLEGVQTSGGSLNEIVISSTSDESGNIYIAGTTFSPELKMGPASKESGWEDAYLAKFDAGGNKVWERGYADTIRGNRGDQMDRFWSVHAVDNRIFCFGGTRNYHNPPDNLSAMDNWLVIFNQNGEVISDMILPTLHVPWFYGDHYFGSVELENKDILFRWSTPENYGTSNHDTSAVLIRYSTADEAVKWVNYYKTGTDAGNMMPIGELANGDLVTCKYDATVLVRLDGTTGNVISSTETGIHDQMGDMFTLFADNITIHSKGRDHYILGSTDDGVTFSYAANWFEYTFNESQPWIFKFNDANKMVYSKAIDIQGAEFDKLLFQDDGSVLLVGNIRSFGTKRRTLFLMTLDQKGEIVKPVEP